ncbi:MAG: GAF domain-containing protein, partial [Chloroflexota bacterium]
DTPLDQIVGRTTRDFIDQPEEADMLRQQVDRAGGHLSVVVPVRSPGGAQLWLSVSIRAITYEDEGCYLALLQDVTRLREAATSASREARERRALAEIGRIASSTLDIDQVYAQFAAQARQLIPADRVVLNTANPDGETFADRYTDGLEVPSRSAGHTVPLDGSLTGHAIRSREGLILQPVDSYEQISGQFPNLAGVEEGLRAYLAVPLKYRGEAIGTLQFGSRDSEAYTDHHLRLAESIAAQISAAVANSQLHALSDRQAQLEASLARIGRIISSSPDIKDVYPRFADEVSEHVPADTVRIDTVDLESGVGTVRYTRGVELPGRGQGAEMMLDGALIGSVARSRQGTYFDAVDDPKWQRELPRLMPWVKLGIRSFACVPLLSEDRVIGLLTLNSTRQSAFNDGHMRFLERVADQIAGAIANDELRRTVDRQAREEAALAEIGRTVSSSLEIEDVFDRFTAEATDLIPADRVRIATVDEQSQTFTERYVWGNDVQGRAMWEEAPLQGSFTGRVFANRKGIRLQPDESELEELRRELPAARQSIDEGFRSVLGVPLISRDRVIGTLHFMSRTPAAYRERDLHLAERIAAQIAGAVANAQLHGIVDRQAHEEAALAEIGRVINSSLDIDEVYERFSRAVVKLIPADRVRIATVNAERGTFAERYSHGLQVSERKPGDELPLEGSLTGLVTQRKQPIVIQPADEDEARETAAAFPLTEPSIRWGIRSMLGVPLIAGDHVVGTLHLLSRRRGAYTERDTRLSERVAAQIAGAVQNAELHSLVNAKAREQQGLATISRIITSTLDIHKVMDDFVEELRGLIPADRVVVNTVDVSAGTYSHLHHSGVMLEGPPRGQNDPLEGTITGHVVKVGHGVIVQSPGDGMELVNRFPGLRGPRYGLRSHLVTPLISDAVIIGALHLQSTAPMAYDEEHLRLCGRIADHIAGAVANSRLHQAVNRRAEEQRVLAEVGRIISSSLDLQQVYEKIGEQVRRLVPATGVAVATVDLQDGTFTPVYRHGMNVPSLPLGQSSPMEGSGVAHVVGSRRGILLQPASQGELETLVRELPKLKPLIERGMRSFLMVPMISDGQVVGVLHLPSDSEHAYSPHHLELAESVGVQVAGAIMNAELHSVVNRQREEARLVSEVGRILGGSLDIQSEMGQFAHKVESLLPVDRIEIGLIDTHRGVITGGYSWGAEPAVGEDGEEDTSALANTVPLHVIQQQAGVVIRQDHPEEFLQRFPNARVLMQSGYAAVIVAPLVTGNEPIGVLTLRSRRVDAYGQRELELAERIAAQIAGPVATVQLHERAVQLARERALRAQADAANEAKSRFLSSVSHELKTPLTSIMAFMDLLARERHGALTDEQRKYLRIMKRNSYRLSLLISDLLDVTLIEEGKLELAYEDFDARALLEEVADSMLSTLDGKGQELAVELPQDAVWMRADRKRIGQVITNLLSNASKYSESGSMVTLNSSVSAQSLEVRVDDEGIGMSQEEVARAFDPFYRADNESTRVASGTGLGLSIARALVDLHEGQMSVETAPGKGSSFKVTLPGVLDRSPNVAAAEPRLYRAED